MRAWLVLMVACSSAAPPPLGNAREPATTTRVVLFQPRHATWSVVLGCSPGRGRLDGDVGHCLALVEPGSPASNLLGSRLTLGKRRTGTCSESRRTYDLVDMTGQLVPEDYEASGAIDPRSELLVWPTGQVKALRVPSAATGPFDLAAATRLLEEVNVRKNLDPHLRPGVGTPVVVGVLRADLDGDGTLDEVWRVDAEEDGMLGGLFAKLSTRAELVLIQASPIYLEAVGAIDLDGDGKAELVTAEHYASALDVGITQYRDGAFTLLRAAMMC